MQELLAERYWDLAAEGFATDKLAGLIDNASAFNEEANRLLDEHGGFSQQAARATDNYAGSVRNITGDYWNAGENLWAYNNQLERQLSLMQQMGFGGFGGGGGNFAGGFASGGHIPAGMAALVGEQGPELVRTRAGGGVDVSSNRDTRKALGGGGNQTFNITINARTDNPRKMAEMVAPELDYAMGKVLRRRNLDLGVANG